MFPSFVRRMSTLAKLPEVDIDSQGVFKYILIKLTVEKEGSNGTNEVVRGYAECPYHSDINDKFTEELQKKKKEGALANWKTKVLGGGRINHDPDSKSIKVYGYSQGYGKADHKITVDLLKKVYTDYDITWSDDGY